MKTAILFAVLLLMMSVANGQLLEVGPPDPQYCEKLKVDANLVVDQDADIGGILIDGSGEPFRNSRVDLRAFISPTKQTNVTAVMTDANGQFLLGRVKAGKYRLVASPTRAFQQPPMLKCTSKRCEFSITLATSPTDQPGFNCPVR